MSPSDVFTDGERPSSQKHRVNRGKIVDLALDDVEQHEQHQIRPAEQAIGSQTPGDQQAAEAGQPDGEVGRMLVDHLAKQELDRRDPSHDVLVQMADESQCRPVVLNLPHEVRGEQHQGNQPAEPEPSTQQVLAGGRDRETCHQPEAPKEHAVFVEESQAGDRADQEP